nr:immunoglobulin light chain junction region [Macaca mulatta]MOW40534.1 immunoglobulin light chain junction region [Macaca mulatta]
CYQYFSGYMF